MREARGVAATIANAALLPRRLTARDSRGNASGNSARRNVSKVTGIRAMPSYVNNQKLQTGERARSDRETLRAPRARVRAHARETVERVPQGTASIRSLRSESRPQPVSIAGTRAATARGALNTDYFNTGLLPTKSISLTRHIMVMPQRESPPVAVPVSTKHRSVHRFFFRLFVYLFVDIPIDNHLSNIRDMSRLHM